MFRKKKKTQTEIVAEITKIYEKKEITAKTLRQDIYGTIMTGLLTTFSAGMCAISSLGFVTGMYGVGERLFEKEPLYLADNAVGLILLLGIGILASGFTAKMASKFTIKNYNQFKEHREEYHEKNREMWNSQTREYNLLEKRLEQTKVQASLSGY